MTGIILVIVGVLLAAAAALFVIFYGGDAYNAGNARAAAATIVNMGENVQHAATLYRMQEGGEPVDLAALVEASYLSAPPEPGSLGKPSPRWRVMRPLGAEPVNAYVIDDMDEKVCREINRQTGHDDVVLENQAVELGCTSGVAGMYFFAKVGHAGSATTP